MHGLKLRWLFLLGIIILAGCSSDDDDDDDAPAPVEITTGFLQVINAIPDSPTISIAVEIGDGTNNINVTQSFREATSVRSVEPGTVTLSATDLDPSTGEVVTLLDEENISISVGNITLAILTGSYLSPDLLLIERPVGTVRDSDTDAEIHLIYAGSQDSVDIYFDDVESTETAAPRTSLTPGTGATPFTVDSADTFRLSVTEPGGDDPFYIADNLFYTSGSSNLLLIVDKPSTNPPGTNVLTVFESGITGLLTNLALKPKLRFLNAVVDGELSLTVLDSFTGETLRERDLEFQDVSEYIEADEDSVFQDIHVRLSGNPDMDPYITVVSLEGDVFYTLALSGSFSDESVATHLSRTNEEPLATFTRIKFINAARSTELNDLDEEVDAEYSLYALQAGESLENSGPFLRGMSYLETAETSILATDTVLVMTETDTKNVVAGPEPVMLQNAASILVTLTEREGGGEPFELVTHIQSR